MKHSLEVNRRYINRIGHIVKIVEKTGSARYKGDDGIEYGLVGVAINKGASWDLIEQDDDHISKMLHALGISYHNDDVLIPNKRYRPYPTSYRNHYQIKIDEDWEEMIKLGYADKGTSIDLNYYYVTKEGKEYLKEMGYRWKER